MSFAFNATAGLILVESRVHGPKGDMAVRLALDTGATTTMLNADVFAVLGYDPASEARRVHVTTGSGVEFAPLVAVEKIEALAEERHGLEVLCHTLPPSATVHGVLGLDFFRNRRLTVDFRSGLVDVS
jgi:predicted aspartyl protease